MFSTRNMASQESLSDLPLIRQFIDRVEEMPKSKAIYVRRRGIWVAITWIELANAVAECTRLLAEQGVSRGDTVLIIGDPSPEWLVAELATQALGALPAVVDGSIIDALANPPGGKSPVAILTTFSKLARSKKFNNEIIDADIVSVSVPRTIEVKLQVLDNKDQSSGRDDANYLLKVIVDRDSTEGCGLFCSAGTSSRLEWSAISSQMVNATWSPLFNELKVSSRDRIAAPKRIDHWFGRLSTLTMLVSSGAVIYFTDELTWDPETVSQVKPTIWLASARSWELATGWLSARMQRAGFVASRLYRAAMWSRSKSLSTGGTSSLTPVSWCWSVCSSWSRVTVFRPLLGQIGLKSMRVGIIYGSDFQVKSSRDWQTWGANLVVTYGSLESGGVVAFSGYGASGLVRHFDGVGDIKLADSQNGELKISTSKVSGGFIPSATGDHLFSTEGSPSGIRRSDSYTVMPSGKKVSLTDIEILLQDSELIFQAVVWLGKEGSIDALFELNVEAAESWARKSLILFTTRTDLVSNQKLLALIREHVSKSNLLLISRGLPVITNFFVTVDLPEKGVLSRNGNPMRKEIQELGEKLKNENTDQVDEKTNLVQSFSTEAKK